MDTRAKAKSTETNFHGGHSIPSLRWWICALLFVSTVINYIDRQTLSLLKQDYHWRNTHYANAVIGFRVAYPIGQALNGRLVDRIGTIRRLTERHMILADSQEDQAPRKTSPRWRDLPKLPQTRGTMIARSFTDLVFFFIADWFPIYLIAKGITLRSGLIAVWIPLIAADLGNFFSGWLSGFLLNRGWSVGNAPQALVVFGGFGIALLILTILTVNLHLLTLPFALGTFSYASFTTIANVLPSDLYKNESVATVSGFGGTGAALGTTIVFELAGQLSDGWYRDGDALVRPAHGYRGPDSLCGDDSRAYAGAQSKGDGSLPGPPNLRFLAPRGCQCGRE